MASPAPAAPRVTPEEYLALERRAAHKSEYWHGEIFAMAGASLSHVRIQSNLNRLAGSLLPRSCEILGSDMKVGIHRGKHGFSYPDATIVCGEPEFADAHRDVITNPIVIFEILSPSTGHFDRVIKFAEYRQLASLRHYVRLSQDQILVEHFARQPDSAWLLRILGPGDSLHLADLELTLPIAPLYHRVELPPPPDSSTDPPAAS